jgi:hypothetical protein
MITKNQRKLIHQPPLMNGNLRPKTLISPIDKRLIMSYTNRI